MDLTSTSAVLGVLVAAAATSWSILEARAPLRKLERVSAILKDMQDDDPGKESLLFLQQDLARRINRAYRAPRRGWDVALAWFLRVCGGLLVSTAYLVLVLWASRFIPRAAAPTVAGDLWTWLVYGAVGVAMLGVASITLAVRERARTAWIQSHDSAETSGPKL
ncbi:hypothetical protein [Frondihabitans peucedani]|uniref:Uncharacterized protein n=1 Tax=Frondihabitans peucedani TaxID=598626 RepID=A0ABP8E1A4_9MICO